jgi:serine/threonine-protein kinase RsbW
MTEQAAGETVRVDTFLGSLLESADTAEQLALGVAAELGFDEEELHRLGIAVRETVVNAVVHGNRYNARKKVHLVVASNQERLTVTVTDEGAGFDWTSLPDPVAAENLLEQSGRGLFLMRSFVDQVDIRRVSPAGAEVKLVKHRKKMVA